MNKISRQFARKQLFLRYTLGLKLKKKKKKSAMTLSKTRLFKVYCQNTVQLQLLLKKSSPIFARKTKKT